MELKLVQNLEKMKQKTRLVYFQISVTESEPEEVE